MARRHHRFQMVYLGFRYSWFKLTNPVGLAAGFDKNADTINHIFVKIAPDLKIKELEEIAKIALETKIDGLIVSNTTIDRSQINDNRPELLKGGLSGKPLLRKSTDIETVAS